MKIPYKILTLLSMFMIFSFVLCSDDNMYDLVKRENNLINPPAINENFFPNTEYECCTQNGQIDLFLSMNSEIKYWTSTRYKWFGFDLFYAINFDDGLSSASDETKEYYVRCIRGSSPPNPHTSNFPIPDSGQTKSYTNTYGEDSNYTTPQAMNYTDNKNGTVNDNVTGLMWTKCTMSDGEMDSTGGCTNLHKKYKFNEALNACGNLDFAGHNDWRLPTITELFSIIHFGKTGENR